LNPPSVDVSARSRSCAAPATVLSPTIVLVMFAEPLFLTAGLPESYWLR
jgi:hypothetical protein